MTVRQQEVYHTPMAFADATVPQESDWLCEGCGYVLNGLPHAGRCPECGKPIGESDVVLRVLPAWERPEAGPVWRRFLVTSAQVVFHPSTFYRTLITRDSRSGSRRFAQIYWVLVSLLFAAAAYLHAAWFLSLGAGHIYVNGWIGILSLSVIIYGALVGATRLAARLTTWEATYRGIRLPLPVVLRGLDYHAAHYLPVALVTAGTVIGYRIYLVGDPYHAVLDGQIYLYVLCVEVFVAAYYLFKTYWIAMKNMMYASR